MSCGLLTFVTHKLDCFQIYELPRIVTLAKVICIHSVYMYVRTRACTHSRAHTHTHVCVFTYRYTFDMYVCIYIQSIEVFSFLYMNTKRKLPPLVLVCACVYVYVFVRVQQERWTRNRLSVYIYIERERETETESGFRQDSNVSSNCTHSRDEQYKGEKCKVSKNQLQRQPKCRTDQNYNDLAPVSTFSALSWYTFLKVRSNGTKSRDEKCKVSQVQLQSQPKCRTDVLPTTWWSLGASLCLLCIEQVHIFKR